MKRIISLTLCFFYGILCIAQSDVHINVKTLKTVKSYNISFDSFNSNTTPQSVWEERIDSVLNDPKSSDKGLAIHFMHSQKRAENESVSRLIKEKCDKQKDSIECVIKEVLAPYKMKLNNKYIIYLLYFAQTSELQELLLLIKDDNGINDNDIQLEDSSCIYLIREIARMNLISPWDVKSIYWSGYMGRFKWEK